MTAAALEHLQHELEMAGYTPGTTPFEREFRRRKVSLCLERQGVSTCSSCPYFDHCELLKQHVRDLNEAVQEQKRNRDSEQYP